MTLAATALTVFVPAPALLSSPAGPADAVAALSLSAGLSAGARRVRLAAALTGGLALAAAAVLDTAHWVVASAMLLITGLIARLAFPSLWPEATTRRAELGAWLGLGIGVPGLLFAAIVAIGRDDSLSALTASLRFLDVQAPITLGASTLTTVALSLAGLELLRRGSVDGRGARPLTALLALGCVAVFVARQVWSASLVGLATDMMTWSEAPFLLHMLKLRAHLPLFGPLEDAGTYVYSPGTELVHFALLRPLGLELSLPASRALVLLWQALSTGAIVAALRSVAGPALRPALGRWLVPFLVASVGSAVTSTMLGPHVHPDQLGKLAFAAALGLVVTLPRRSERAVLVALVTLPPLAVACKLTCAGIGAGLLLVALVERRARWVLAALVGGALGLATIPLYDALVGPASLYTIRVQGARAWEWERLPELLGSFESRALLVSIALLVALRLTGPPSEITRASTRAALVTAGYALAGGAAFLKHAGIANNLVPMTIGAVVITILAVAELTARARASSSRAALAPALCLWAAIAISPPEPPLHGELRRRAEASHERATRWLREQLAAGHSPLPSASLAAWIAAGRTDAPRDIIGPASEMFLGRWPQLAAHERRLLDGTYDGILLTSSMLLRNELMVSLRPRLEAVYDLAGHPGEPWVVPADSVVFLERKRGGAPPALVSPPRR